MPSAAFRSPRRAVQYWSVIALSLVIPAAALLGETSDVSIPMNATLLSLVLLGSTVFELAGLHRLQDISRLLGAIWLIASPFAFGYADAGQLRYWHLASGALLALLTTINLWEDSKLRQKR